MEHSAQERPQPMALMKNDAVRDVVVVLGLSGVANALLYAYMAITARVLQPVEYGAFAAVFSVVALVGVAVTGLQTAMAKRVAGMSAHHGVGTIRRLERPLATLSLTVFVVLGVLAPGINRLLDLDEVGLVLAAAVFAAVLVPWSAVIGLYQGLGRVREMAGLVLLQAAARVTALVVLAMSLGKTALMLATGLAIVGPLLVARARLAPPKRAGDTAPWSRVFDWFKLNSSSAWLAVLPALAMGFPTLADVFMVRSLFSATEAGLYAGVALVGRVVLFLILGVSLVMFPRFVRTSGEAGHRATLCLGLKLISLLVAGPLVVAVVVPESIVAVLIGQQYTAAAHLVPVYVAGSALAGLGAFVSHFHLTQPRAARRLIPIVPLFLAGHLLLPIAFSRSLATLVTAQAVLGAAYAGLSLLATRPSWDTND